MHIPVLPFQCSRHAFAYSAAGQIFQLTVDKDGHSYFATLEIKNVTVEDAGKYKVTAKNELGESNATISLNFDSKYHIITAKSMSTCSNFKH